MGADGAVPTLGKRVRSARLAIGMSLRDFARTMGVSAAYLSDVEHDRRTLSPDRIAQAARVLGIQADTLRFCRGYQRDVEEWLRERPDLVQLLRVARATGAPVLLGEPRRAPGGAARVEPQQPHSDHGGD